MDDAETSRTVPSSSGLFMAHTTPISPDDAGWHPSVTLLLIGCVGAFDRMFAWFANPGLIAAWILMRSRSRQRRVTALCCAIASLALSLSFLLQRQILADEAGHYSRITGYGPGYWLWVASILAALVGCVVATSRNRHEQGRDRA
jgi:hypothetical protein